MTRRPFSPVGERYQIVGCSCPCAGPHPLSTEAQLSAEECWVRLVIALPRTIQAIVVQMKINAMAARREGVRFEVFIVD
jgi:hypothetical protein